MKRCIYCVNLSLHMEPIIPSEFDDDAFYKPENQLKKFIVDNQVTKYKCNHCRKVFYETGNGDVIVPNHARLFDPSNYEAPLPLNVRNLFKKSKAVIYKKKY